MVAQVAGRDAWEAGPKSETEAISADELSSGRETVGATLRLAREAAGLSREEVALRTKVRPGFLAAIEEDRHDDLPALAYTSGFVKAFARTVGLDPHVMAERYRAESQKGEPAPSIIDLEPLDERRVPSRGLVAVTIAALLAAVGLFWAWGAGLFDAAAPPPPQVAERMVPVPAPDEPGAAGPTAPPPSADAPVTIRAREEAWVRIDNRETGDRFYEGTMAEGQELALPPGEPLQLRTGRAGALEIRVGSEAMPPLGGPVEQVRNISLLPGDLAARSPTVPEDGLAAAPTPGLSDAPRPPTS
jgi:cytoskeleton protein RodZ